MLLLSDLTDPASSPAIKCYCFTQTTRTEHEKKVRWQRSSPPLTTVSFRQTNFVLEHNVLNDTGSVPEGKALTCPPPPAPWQSAKIAHSHQLRLRLQAAGRRKTIGSWVQSTSIGCWLQQQRQEGWGGGESDVENQYHNTGYLSLSPPPPETSNGFLTQVRKHQRSDTQQKLLKNHHWD